MPDYAERQRGLGALQDRLEEALAPRVSAAFAEHDVDAAKEHIMIYRDMGRECKLAGLFAQCHKAPLLRQWAAFSTRSGDAAGSSAAKALAEFHDALASVTRVTLHPLP